MTEATIREQQQKQVDENYAAFLQRLQDSEFYRQHYGKYALMHDRKIVDLFDSWDDAHKTAKLLYTKANELFSIQKVDDAPVDLGFYSHAIF